MVRFSTSEVTEPGKPFSLNHSILVLALVILILALSLDFSSVP